MQTFAVVQIGGKQFVVSEGDQIIVENVNKEQSTIFDVPVLMTFDAEGKDVKVGTPELAAKAKGEVVENMKGTKIRVAKFKSKVRYRKVMGFRPQLSKIKITNI